MARVEMNMRNILLIVAVVILLASGSAYTVFTIIGAPFGERAPTEAKPVREKDGPILSIEAMTVNLSGRSAISGRVVRAGIAFELDSDKTKKHLEEREEQVKDRIISTIRQQTLESVSTNEGLDELRTELKHSVGALLFEGEVKDVYLFEWVVP